MKYFERNRRRLTKQHYMRGTQKSVSGTSSVKIEDSAGVPIKSIEITGNTVQDINLEQMDSYLDYFKNTDNYSSAGASYTYRIALPSERQGKELTFTLGEISKMTGITVKLSDGDNALLSSSQILLSSNGEISSVTSKAYKYLIFTGVIGTPYEVDGIGYTELTEIIEFWNNYQMTVTGTMTAFPQPIQNANDNGMSVVLHGKNLALATEVFNKSKGYKDNVIKDGRNCLYFKGSGSYEYVIDGGFKENTRYTISFDMFSEKYGSETHSYTLRIVYTDGSLNWISGTFALNKWTKRTLETKSGKTIKSIGQIAWDNVPVYIDKNTFLIYEGAVTSPEYEPYFWNEIPLPTSLEVSGEEIPLILSEYDRLVVDTSKNKVIYHNGGYYKDFYASSGMGSSTNPSKVWAKIPCELTGNGYCSHFEKNSFAFENNLGFGTSGISFPTSVFASTTALSDFLEEQTTNGTPLTILAEKQTPTEYDITSTELGQALLSLCVPLGASGTLEITSNLEPTSLDVVYYSEIEEDKVELTVCYVNEAGEDIAEPKAYQVRRGSKYQMVVPHIDGYTRIQESVFGVASNNDVINLTYKEDNDVSV